MKDTGLDHRHRDKDGAISKKHGNTLVGTLRKIYGRGFAAGYPDTTLLSDVLLQLNETSLSQLRRDHDTGHLGHKIDPVPKKRTLRDPLHAVETEPAERPGNVAWTGARSVVP